jgi:hypothetical protein
VWQTQVLAAMRGAWLVDLLDGTSSTPQLTIGMQKQEKIKEEAENPAYA